MKWLVWKDYRQNRPVVVMVLFLLLTPHTVAFCCACWMTYHGSYERSPWTLCFGVSSLLSVFATQFLLAIIGGNAFAGERGDRSAEFLASLPITRGRILASKLILALTIIAAIWLINAPGLTAVAVDAMRSQREASEIMRIVLGAVITGTAFFCIAWAFSSFLTSTTFAVVGGLAGAYFLVLVSAFVIYLLGLDLDVYVPRLYCGFCLALAPACFVAGTWYYLRRVEP
jgi:ABC-type transport system involved in multi-copper enzyme maturation permease subunit